MLNRNVRLIIFAAVFPYYLSSTIFFAKDFIKKLPKIAYLILVDAYENNSIVSK